MYRLVLAVAAFVAGLSGCATPARYIEKSADSGVVAVPANTNVWPTYYQSEAMALIRKHVGPNFEIVEEREVATGKTTVNNEQINNEQLLNKQIINNTTTTQDVTEWRIVYRKKLGAMSTVNGGMAQNPPKDFKRGTGSGIQQVGASQPAGGLQSAGGTAPAGSSVQQAGGPISPLGASSSVIPAVGPGPLPPTGGPGVYGSTGAFVGQMR